MAARPPRKPRSVKVEDELWEAAKATAEQRGEILSEVIRDALKRYVVTDADRAALGRPLRGGEVMGERVVAGPRSPKCEATRGVQRCWLVADHEGGHESQSGQRWRALVVLDRRADAI